MLHRGHARAGIVLGVALLVLSVLVMVGGSMWQSRTRFRPCRDCGHEMVEHAFLVADVERCRAEGCGCPAWRG